MTQQQIAKQDEINRLNSASM